MGQPTNPGLPGLERVSQQNLAWAWNESANKPLERVGQWAWKESTNKPWPGTSQPTNPGLGLERVGQWAWNESANGPGTSRPMGLERVGQQTHGSANKASLAWNGSALAWNESANNPGLERVNQQPLAWNESPNNKPWPLSCSWN